eukprot:TRINITY_DN4778_c0_g1_i1.p1 TRINITY_DN4778_c0_g1~~TRINITY_DN4778_c0_g1_i1.p1  ORF type:complete len:292 (+),score=100.71 TRINITY_DN4778_c0_g1_i1:110-985(+)
MAYNGYGYGAFDAGQPMASGGGFISSPGAFDASQPAADSPPRKGRSGAAQQHTMPVTCKQLCEATQAAPDDAFRVDGRELSQVTVCGMVLELTEQTTHYSFVIDDGSGRLDVRLWLDAQDNEHNSFVDELRRTAWREHSYVRVVGHLRSFQQRRNVVAFRIQPLADPNELTCHLLDVIAVHLYNSRGAPRSAASSVPVAAPFPGAFASSSAAVAPPRAADGAVGQPLHKLILDVIRQRASAAPEGCSVQFLAQQLRRPDSDIRLAVDFLSSEGHLYSTIDEDHYQTTDAGV